MYYDLTIGQGAAVPASAQTPPSQTQSISDDAKVNHASENAATGAELPWGTWFDDAYDFRDPEGDAVTTAVLNCVAVIETRKRRRRAKDAENYYRITRSILANALRCHYFRDPQCVAFTSGAEQQYYKSTPAWLNGEAMKRTLCLLENAGLVTLTTGRWQEASSTYVATPALLEIAAQHDITVDSLKAERLRPERLVRLYRQKSGNSSLVAFKVTEETEYWTIILTDYNAFIAQQDISLALSAAEQKRWVARWNARREEGGGGAFLRPKVIRPELIQTDLHRCFNNGWNECFMEGGRLYGAWWVNTPGHLRKKITINGQPVIEADFAGCQPRMLYHDRNIDYREDPYELELLTDYARSVGLPDDHYRDAVKMMMQALINGRSSDKLELAPLKYGYSYDPFDPLEVRQMIEEKHKCIKDDFGTAIGLNLQRKDSDLALTIITNLMRRGIAALPVHDSFIVAEEHQHILIEEMDAAYRKAFKGYSPIVKVDGLRFYEDYKL